MAIINYKFVASGLGNIIKAHIYPLVPVKEGANTNAGDKQFSPTGVKVPMVSDTDLLGEYLVMPLNLKTESGKSLDIYEAVVSITKKKSIVTTRVVGGDGTVKEFISDDDMDVSIDIGIVTTDSEGNIIDAYPADGVKEVCAILDERAAIQATSPFLKLFGIDGGNFKLVVTDYSIQQSTHSNHQVVSIKAVSDWDYVIFNEEN